MAKCKYRGKLVLSKKNSDQIVLSKGQSANICRYLLQTGDLFTLCRYPKAGEKTCPLLEGR